MNQKRIIGLCMLLLVVLMPLALASQTNVALTYDANGNLLTNGDKRYVYDGFNRLAEVFINETIKEKYWYDPDGNRLLKVEFHTDGSNTTTFYIDESFIRIINSSGTYDEVYYYDEYDLIAKEDSEGKKFYHPDHLGSTTLVTDESGNVVEETVYDPFGAVQEGGNERYDYEGKEVDSTGLQYFGARYYDPNKIFKWTQPDDLLPDVYDPQQLNRYSFERNNPYKHEDANGHLILEALLVASIAAAIISGVVMINKIQNDKDTRSDWNYFGASSMLTVSSAGTTNTVLGVVDNVNTVYGVSSDVKYISDVASNTKEKDEKNLDPGVLDDERDPNQDNDARFVSTWSYNGNHYLRYGTPSYNNHGSVIGYHSRYIMVYHSDGSRECLGSCAGVGVYDSILSSQDNKNEKGAEGEGDEKK